MRTELAVALIAESDALNTRTFCVMLSQHLTILELMDIFPTDFYLRWYKCTYKSNLKHCGEACYPDSLNFILLHL